MTIARPALPDSYEGMLGRARLARRAGDVESAIETYRRLAEKLGGLSERILARRTELRDLHLQARVELAELLRQQDRYAEAIDVEQGLLTTHPEQSSFWRRDLALMRVAKGEVERGLAELHALAEEAPGDVWNWIVLGNETRIEARYAESRAALDQALELAKQGKEPKILAEVYYERFRLFRAQGQVDDALAAWEEAASAQPEMIRTIREVYDLLTDAGRYGEARQYAARDENQLQAGFQRGLLEALTGDAVQARREWQAVAGLDPTEFEYGHDRWVEAVLRLGDPTPALERLPDLLKQHGSVRLLVFSGIAWAMRGDRERAEKLFERTIGLLRRDRPPKQKLDSADWRLLDSLVADEALKAALKPYFAVIATLWS